MARIIVEKNPYRIKLPGQLGNLVKTMDSETEPPKDYLWLTPRGDTYLWYCGDWVLLDDFLAHPYYSCVFDGEHYEELDEHLENFEQYVMDKVAEYVVKNMDQIIEIDNRVSELEAIDHSQFITAEDVE